MSNGDVSNENDPDGNEPHENGPPDENGRAPTYGFELPLLLFGGFRSIIDELHAELARRGHPDLRPAHGFALQAIGPRGATATEAGRAAGDLQAGRGQDDRPARRARLRAEGR